MRRPGRATFNFSGIARDIRRPVNNFLVDYDPMGISTISLLADWMLRTSTFSFVAAHRDKLDLGFPYNKLKLSFLFLSHNVTNAATVEEDMVKKPLCPSPRHQPHLRQP